jgi:iron(III) transport system ATP-binding protein
MAIRPEDVLLGSQADPAANTLPARILGLEFRGPLFRVSLQLSGGEGVLPLLHADLPAEAARRLALHQEMEIPVRLPCDRIRVYPT